MSLTEQAAAVLIGHQRIDFPAMRCLCGWNSWGGSHADHVVEQLVNAGLLAPDDDPAGLPFAASDYGWHVENVDSHSARVVSRGISHEAAHFTAEALADLGGAP